MTPADRTRRAAERRTEEPAALSETFVLLDNNSGGGPPSLLFTDPVEIIAAETPQEVPAALERLEAAVNSGLHAAGFFAYELGYVLEPRLSALMPAKRNVPLIWLGLYKSPAEMTPREVEHWLATHTRSGSYSFTDVSLAWDEPAYLQRFTEVQEKIRAGDIYQLNLTFKARFKLSGSPLTFFLDLRQKQRVAYGGIVDTGKVTVLSASPEVFIEQDGRAIATRPMKGTAPRAGTLEADALAQRQLAEDVKQRAENLMIVDLMRNDIGRIAEIGSVSVTDLFTVETYPDAAPDDLGRARNLEGRHRHRRRAARHLSAGLGDGRAEDQGHGAHLGAGDRAARRLLRRDRPHLAQRAHASERRHPHRGGVPRLSRGDGHRLGRRLRFARTTRVRRVPVEDEVPHRPGEAVRAHRDHAL